MVGLSGGRACVFKGCTITLDDKDGDPAAVVAVLEVTREMRMGPADAASVPDVQFTNTLVRGKGRAVWVSVARSFSVTADNSAFALDGSFLAMDPPLRNAGAAEASVKLTHVTTLLSGPLLELRAAKDPMARVVPVNVSVDRCLFAPVAPTRPGVFVSIDDAEPGAEPRRYLSWDARGASVYANAEKQTALELRPWDDSPATTWDIARWREFGRDAGTDGKVSFAGKNLRNRLTLVRLADLKAERSDTRTAVEAGLRFGDE